LNGCEFGGGWLEWDSTHVTDRLLFEVNQKVMHSGEVDISKYCRCVTGTWFWFLIRVINIIIYNCEYVIDARHCNQGWPNRGNLLKNDLSSCVRNKRIESHSVQLPQALWLFALNDRDRMVGCRTFSEARQTGLGRTCQKIESLPSHGISSQFMCRRYDNIIFNFWMWKRGVCLGAE
jgi:hypothetical protein